MSQQFSLEGFAPAPLTDRLFFAIFPDSRAAGLIAQAAQQLRDQHALKGRPLRTDRFHITLQHIDDYPGLPPAVVAAAIKAAQSLVMPPFEISFDRAVSFSGRPGNRPFVLRGGDGVAGVMEFQRGLGTAMRRAGLAGKVASRYEPHVTLLYDAAGVEEQAIEPIRWTAHEFVLVHSLIGQTRHVPLGRWPLVP